MIFLTMLSVLTLIGYIGFGAYFLMNAYNHLFKTEHLVGYAQFKGVAAPWKAIVGSGVLLVIGGLAYVLAPVFAIFGGITFSMYIVFAIARCALLLFLIPVSIKMHAYWKETDPQQRQAEHISFFKNMALAAAVLMTLL